MAADALRPDPHAPPAALVAAVHGTRDFASALRDRAAALQKQPPSPALAEGAIDLAQALEMAEPDLSVATGMYLLAWKASRGRVDALRRARHLSLEIGDFATAAKIARLDFQQTGVASALVAEGICWLDAGEPHRAVRVFEEAARHRADDGDVELFLRAARRDHEVLESEMRWLNVATGDRSAAGARFLRAARLGRLLGVDELAFERLIQRAFEADPMNDAALAQLEATLIARGNAPALMRVYQARAALAAGQAVDVLRRAGTKLVLGRTNPGLGLQMIGAGLDRAYRQRMIPIAGHLALIVLLREYSESAAVERDLLSLLAQALAVSQPPIEETALAAVGLEVAWSRLRDSQEARPYAAVLARLSDSHPSLAAYCAEGGMMPDPPRPPEPVKPDTGAFRGLPRSAAPSDVPEEVPIDLTGEILEGVLEDEEDDVDVDVDVSAVAAPPPKPPALARPPARPKPVAPPPTAAAVPSLVPRPGEKSAPHPVAAPAVTLPSLPRAPQVAKVPVPSAALAALMGVPLRPIKVVAPQPAEEFRVSQRINVAADIRARVPARDLAFSTVTRDVSDAGIFLIAGVALEVGDAIEMTIEIPSLEEFTVDSFAIVGRVARVSDNGVGIKLESAPAPFVARVRDLAEK